VIPPVELVIPPVDPLRVKVAVFAVAPLTGATDDRTDASKLRISVVDPPCCIPAVTAKCRVGDKPIETFPRSAVVEIHSVVSDAVEPNLSPDDSWSRPKFTPVTVTLDWVVSAKAMALVSTVTPM
jgi:hypothetical protein